MIELTLEMAERAKLRGRGIVECEKTLEKR